MDVTRVAVVDAPRPVAAWQGVVTLALAALVAIGFLVAVAVPYLTLDEQVLARYSSVRVWLLLHIIAGAVALLTGPVQLWLGVSGRTTSVHRRLGVAYATAVGIGAAASFYLAAHTSLGWGFRAGITGLGIAWVATTTLAIAAIRRGLIEQHRDWMVRSYVVTFAFVTFRALFEGLKAAGVGTLQEQLAVSSWFCWAAPLLVTEIVLQGRRIFGARRLGAAAMGLAIAIGVAAPADAQARLTAADLEGSVTDESGGVLPETLVTVVNTETNVARAVETDGRGPAQAESSTIGRVESRKEARFSAAPDFHIGRWLAQPTLNVIRDGAIVRRLEPQVMDLLAFLATTGGRVVPKDEIIDAVWEGRFIAEATLTRSIADLRRTLGDDQRRPQYIETIPKRGYRLVASVADAGARSGVTPAHEPGTATREGVVERGHVVLPFARPADLERGDSGLSGGRVADRLAAARRRRFVGREAELEICRAALLSDEPQFVTLHFHGPGGVGKTTLFQEFARIAEEAGRAVIRVDGRNVEPSPAGLVAALSGALQAERADLPQVIARWPAGAVLLVDTYELLTPVDDWLRHTLLPQLPARSLVLIAGRDEPQAAWRTDVDWASLTRIQTLENFEADDSRRYLTRCGVPAEHHDDALAFTRGHPLALSLIADLLTRGDRVAASRLDNEPEVVRLLLETFVKDTPSREHRLALLACATVLATTEPLLAAVLERPDAHDIFEWLGHLPFVEHGPYGLFPHDLARDVVYMDFRWRDPDAAFRVTERVLGYLYERLERAQGLERQRVWLDLLYVQRYNRNLRPYFEWEGFGTAYAGKATPGDHMAIVEMVARHEGPESAAIARYWLGRQPDAFHVIRSVGGERVGFLANLHLLEITPDDVGVDPAIAIVRAYAERHGPARPGEEIVYGRFWMDAERHQVFTQVFTCVAATCSQSWIGPNVAWCFVTMADPDAVEPMLTEIHMWRAREADFEIGGRRYGVFAHDWRVEPARDWLRLKAERALRAL